MIILTKLNGTQFVLNDDLIETIEENPDTTVRLTNTHFLIVKESMEEIIRLVIIYRKQISGALPRTLSDEEGY